DRDPGATGGDAVVRDRHGAGIERHAGTAELADDATPIGILAVERALDQLALGDLAGGGDRVDVGGRAGDPHDDHLGRALGVARHLFGQARARLGERGGQRARLRRATPASNAAIGSGIPMSPVEQTRTSSARQPSCAATRAHVRSASARPASPVAALALPLLRTTAVARAAVAARCARDTWTGAAVARLA